MLQLHVPVACSIHPPTHPSIFIASSHHPSIHPSIHLHPLVNGVLIPLPLSSSGSSTDTPPDPASEESQSYIVTLPLGFTLIVWE